MTGVVVLLLDLPRVAVEASEPESPPLLPPRVPYSDERRFHISWMTCPLSLNLTKLTQIQCFDFVSPLGVGLIVVQSGRSEISAFVDRPDGNRDAMTGQAHSICIPRRLKQSQFISLGAKFIATGVRNFGTCHTLFQWDHIGSGPMWRRSTPRYCECWWIPGGQGSGLTHVFARGQCGYIPTTCKSPQDLEGPCWVLLAEAGNLDKAYRVQSMRWQRRESDWCRESWIPETL